MSKKTVAGIVAVVIVAVIFAAVLITRLLPALAPGPVSCVTEGTFDSARYLPQEWRYSISINRGEDGALLSGIIELEDPAGGMIVADVREVKCNYALWYDHPEVSRPSFAAAGTATYGAWEGSFIFLIADSHIQMVLRNADYTEKWSAETLWPLGERDYDIWSDDGGFWVECLCP